VRVLLPNATRSRSFACSTLFWSAKHVHLPYPGYRLPVKVSDQVQRDCQCRNDKSKQSRPGIETGSSFFYVVHSLTQGLFRYLSLQPCRIGAGLPVTNHETCDFIGSVLGCSGKSIVLAALLVCCASPRPPRAAGTTAAGTTAANTAAANTTAANAAPAPVGHAAPLGNTKVENTGAKRDGNAPSKPASKPETSPLTLNASQEQLYQRACTLGSALACNDLGVLLEADRKAAIPIFDKACELGLPRGCTNLAVLLMDDTSQHRRITELLRRSCDKKDGLACSKLGDWIYSSDDTHDKLREAYRVYDRGCTLEDWDACGSSAWMLKSGVGISPDPTLARDRFRLACDHDRYLSCMGLGVSLLEASPGDQQRDFAVSLIEKSCEKSVAAACFYRGAMLVNEDGTIPNSARRQFERACQLGDERGCKLAPLDALPASTGTQEP
jgi:TPR repeat protein